MQLPAHPEEELPDTVMEVQEEAVLAPQVKDIMEVEAEANTTQAAVVALAEPVLPDLVHHTVAQVFKSQE
jgi:hypothetical protein